MPAEKENKTVQFLESLAWRFLALASIVSFLVNSFSPGNALAATLNPGSNFTVCTGVVYLNFGLTPSATVTWSFDSLYGNTQKTYQVQVAVDQDFSSVVADSGAVSNAAARSHVVSSGLQYGTLYHWRLQISDNNDSVIDWLRGDSFIANVPSIKLQGGLKLQGGVKLK